MILNERSFSKEFTSEPGSGISSVVKPMISVGFARVSKKRPCRICGKPTYCDFSRAKVLPSACASVRDLAGYPATVETYSSIPKFPS